MVMAPARRWISNGLHASIVTIAAAFAAAPVGAIESTAKQAILIDFDSEAVLFEKDGKSNLGFTILPAPPAKPPSRTPACQCRMGLAGAGRSPWAKMVATSTLSKR